MPRSLLATAVCIAAALTLSARAAVAQSPPPVTPPPAPAPTQMPVDWQLEQAGRDPLSLDLVAFGSSSCLPGTLSATVVETRARIRIAVVSTRRAQLCTSDYAPTPLTVRLATPVRGRAVVGPHRLRPEARTGPPPIGAPPAGTPLRVPRVPRVTGLAPADALAVVRQHGLRPAIERVADLRSRPRVIGQTPASGHAVRSRADVTLFVSR